MRTALVISAISTPLILLLILLFQFIPVGVNSDQDEDLRAVIADLEDVVEKQEATIRDSRLAQNTACIRRNDERAITVRGNLNRAAAWAVLFNDPLPPTILAFARDQQAANLEEATDLANAQRAVSLAPFSKDLVKRSRVACSKVYPLPKKPTDPLPEPVLPAATESVRGE